MHDVASRHNSGVGMHQPRCTQARRHQQVVLFLQAQETPHNPEPKHAGEHVGCAFTFIERNATRHATCWCGPDTVRLTQHLHTAQTHGILPFTPKTSQNSHAPAHTSSWVRPCAAACAPCAAVLLAHVPTASTASVLDCPSTGTAAGRRALLGPLTSAAAAAAAPPRRTQKGTLAGCAAAVACRGCCCCVGGQTAGTQDRPLQGMGGKEQW